MPRLANLAIGCPIVASPSKPWVTRRYSTCVGELSRQQAADRAGISLEDLNRQIELGVITPEADRFSAGDVRRAGLIHGLENAGIPLDGLAAMIRGGKVSLAFLDSPTYERFAALSDVTFQQLSGRTGVPVELLMVIREAVGSAQPAPDDRMREDELAIVPFIEVQVRAGFRPIAIERLLRVMGDSLRRVAETEGDWWFTEVIEPRVAKGLNPTDAAAGEISDRLGELGGPGPRGDVPRPAGARVDREHHPRHRGRAGEGGAPQPPRAAAGNVLPRHHRIYASDAGAR